MGIYERMDKFDGFLYWRIASCFCMHYACFHAKSSIQSVALTREEEKNAKRFVLYIQIELLQQVEEEQKEGNVYERRDSYILQCS